MRRFGLIDKYLAELDRAGVDRARVLPEARWHLVQATRRQRATGLGWREAQLAAIRSRFADASGSR